MEVSRSSWMPAAAVAAATLLPTRTPKRWLVTAALAGGGYAAMLQQDPEGRHAALDSRGDLDLGTGPRDPVTVALSAVAVGLVAVPAVQIARLLPMRRVVAAGVLAGAVALVDGRLAASGERIAARA